MNIENYNNTKSCPFCRHLFVSNHNYVRCCEDCTNKIIEPIRKIINMYKEEHPTASQGDIINSNIIPIPSDLRISTSEFYNIVFEAYKYTIEKEEKVTKTFDSKLLEDLDKLDQRRRGR